MSTLLGVEDLRVSFGDAIPVVSDISFSLGSGECLGIVGESGSGKSVIARSILGLAGPTARMRGSITVDGAEILGASPRALRRLRGRDIGLISQGALVALDPLRPVGREIADALRLHTTMTARQRGIRAVELLDEVGVPEPQLRSGQRADELSGGLRQRAVIAAAIALRPRLLIADEPTTALDTTVQAGILDLLERLRAEGTAILLISHDLAVVSRLASRIIVVQGGHIVERGETGTVLTVPVMPYTRALLAAVPAGRARGERLIGEQGSTGNDSVAGAVRRPVPVTTEPSADAMRAGPAASLALPGNGTVMEARGLVRRFGPRVAVDRVDFVLERGHTLGVVGESGSGKTTVARLALALDRPDAGDITLLGQPWSAASEPQRRSRRARIGAIYQDALSSFDPRMTVGQILADSLTHGSSTRAGDEVAVLLDRVGLSPDLMRRRPRLLSGGQQQRVAIARAIAPRPDVLVCDEPVSSLDVSVQAQVLDLLDELQERLGLSYLFITHDLGVVRHMSDSILVMRAGRVLERGATENVLGDPQHEYTRALIAASPILP